MSRQIQITIARMEGPLVVAGHVINARWAAVQEPNYRGWNLTHRATGCAAGKGLKDINACRSLALKLEKAYSPERWSFTTCDAAKGMPKAAKLVRDAENEAW